MRYLEVPHDATVVSSNSEKNSYSSMKGYFLDRREVLRCLYKVFSTLCEVRKDAQCLRFIRSAQTSKANCRIMDNWLRNDDTDSLVN